MARKTPMLNTPVTGMNMRRERVTTLTTREVDIGTVMFGDMKVALAQGHGAVEAGKEGHLVVKLPYDDAGATTVRAWIRW